MPARTILTGTAPADTGDRGWRWASIGLFASLGAGLALLAYGGGSRTMPPLPAVVILGLHQLLGIAFAARAWRHRNLDRRTRRAFGMVTAAFLLLLGSSCLRPAYPVGVVFPSPADLLRLLFGPVLLAGLLLLPMRTQGRREQQKVWLDTAVVVIAGCVLMWYLQIGPGLTAGHIGGGALAAALAYPAGDLVLIFGATVVLFRGAAESARQPAKLMGAAMLAVVAGDVILGYRQSHGGQAGADQWQFACWMTGHFLLAMAAFAQCRQAGRHRLDTEPPRARSVSGLPYLAIGLSYVLLLLSVRGLPLRVVGVVAGGIAITAVVVARQILASRENHELAITDTLTGLFNRRQLHDTLRLALARGASSGQSTAALLLDMNGFKQVNDTMGHEAGDRLLVAVSRILRDNVLGHDVVGRLGGDEFAVVLHNIESSANAQAVVERIVADLRNPVLIGDAPVRPRASIGIAVSRPGELTVDQLLHFADLAMYRAKADTRQSGTTSFAHYDRSLEGAAQAPE
ncbi:GGDEF domain-containing protein [Actinoplanes sp. ATCC 53533]|uniref:GGDEF domain-containing protein n=1 Tax=Actinoplanes sp. ATCC 53533 TaxID=1288362 RepID=UPI0013156856|nr:GGDEF domain-containing protein [Actinoplanes sp. ATCC 53533]